MVPVNFYQWKQNIRQVLLIKAETIDDEWDPFVAAWLCYALSIEGIENNQPLLDLLDRMRRWLEQEDVWSYERNLGPVALGLWLFKKTGDSLPQDFVTYFESKVVGLNAEEKLSILRDPEQVFLLASGASAGSSESVKNHLIDLANAQIKYGLLRRRILYAAALRKLGQQVTIPNPEPADEGDIIALVWWAEKYQGDKYRAWQRFSSIAEQIAVSPEEASDTHRILTMPETAMLYEALSQETKHPEPTLLFDYFPFHPRVRRIAADHFKNGKYVASVFEATKALNELIQEVSGVRDKSEVELVQATMKQIQEPSKMKIRFNEFLNEDSGKNEQAGLAAICEGVFKAFRNPKAHKSEDHPLVELDPYQALHQLIVISYLMVRIEKVCGKEEFDYGE